MMTGIDITAFKQSMDVARREFEKAIQQRDELLQELRAAHQIIRNALAVMIAVQKADWGWRNERDGVAGEGVTRANEREAVIKRAEGRQ